jgi:hypothetical protein
MYGDGFAAQQRLTRMVLGKAGRDPGELFAADFEFCFLDTPDCLLEGRPSDVLRPGFAGVLLGRSSE